MPSRKKGESLATQELESALHQGRLSRREFLTRLSAGGLALTLPSLWSHESVQAKTPTNTPKKGGRLRMGLAGGAISDSLDPALITDAMMVLLSFGQLRNNLVEIDAHGQPIPELAESWEALAGATVWRFSLRKSVEFHNGKTLDAEDVIASFNYHRGKDSTSSMKSVLENITDIRQDGQQVVVFTLREGQADFPFLTADVQLPILPAGAEVTASVGTGGYQLVDFEPGVRTLTKRNPNYWKEGRAHFDEVEMLAIADVNARTTALQTGEIDVINRCELKTVHLLQRLPGSQVLQTTGTRHYSLPMLMDVAPFDNNDVRLALKYAIDREALLHTILRGYGTLGNDHPIGQSQRYFATDLAQQHYDPDKAKFHLKRAGLSHLRVSLSASDAAFGGAVDTAVLYKEQAAKCGISIDVVREPADGYWDSVWRRKPFCLCYWSGRPTADWMFSLAYAEGAAWNDMHFRHAQFNRLLKAARAELDESKRSEMYAEMQRIVRDEGGVIIPLFAADVFAAKDGLQFGELAGNWELDGGKCPERWWWR